MSLITIIWHVLTFFSLLSFHVWHSTRAKRHSDLGPVEWSGRTEMLDMGNTENVRKNKNEVYWRDDIIFYISINIVIFIKSISAIFIFKARNNKSILITYITQEMKRNSNNQIISIILFHIHKHQRLQRHQWIIWL